MRIPVLHKLESYSQEPIAVDVDSQDVAVWLMPS